MPFLPNWYDWCLQFILKKSEARSSSPSTSASFPRPRRWYWFSIKITTYSYDARTRGVINSCGEASRVGPEQGSGKETQYWTKAGIKLYTFVGTSVLMFYSDMFCVCFGRRANKTFMKSLITDPIYHSVYVRLCLVFIHICDMRHVRRKPNLVNDWSGARDALAIFFAEVSMLQSPRCKLVADSRWNYAGKKTSVSMFQIWIKSFRYGVASVFFISLGLRCRKYR